MYGGYDTGCRHLAVLHGGVVAVCLNSSCKVRWADFNPLKNMTPEEELEMTDIMARFIREELALENPPVS